MFVYAICAFKSHKNTIAYSRSEHVFNSACLPYQKPVLRREFWLGPQVVTPSEVVFHTFAVVELCRSEF